MPAGNSLSSAQEIILGSRSQSFQDSVTLSPEAPDFYSFTIRQRSAFRLTLTDLNGDANVEILNANGELVRGLGNNPLASTNGGTVTEAISTILDPTGSPGGRYFIRVYAGTRVDPARTPEVRYTLNVQGSTSSQTDLFWRNTGGTTQERWVLNGGVRESTGTFTPLVAGADWRMQTAADVNGDGQDELIFRNYGTGADRGRIEAWFMNQSNPGVRESVAEILVGGTRLTDLNWEIRGSADFNADNREDLLWQNVTPSDGAIGVWFMNGATVSSTSVLLDATGNPGSGKNGWLIQGAGDFDGNGSPDLVWRNYSEGTDRGYNGLWLMNGLRATGYRALGPASGSFDDPAAREQDLNWQIRQVADLDNNGIPDLIWRRDASDDTGYWLMNGSVRVSAALFSPKGIGTGTWQLVPFNRQGSTDGLADLGGNTTATAFNFGALTGDVTLVEAVGGSDTNDYYQFTIDSPTDFTLTLGGISRDASGNLGNLTGNLNAELTGAGAPIQLNRPGTDREEYSNRQLAPGTYTLRVFPATAGQAAVNYTLAITANGLPRLVRRAPVSVTEGARAVISNTNLLITDTNNIAPELTYQVVSLPSAGTLFVSNLSLSAGSSFTQADVDASRLSYANSGAESLSDNFVFTISDGRTPLAERFSLSFNVVPSNDIPNLVSNVPLTLSEGTVTTLSSTNLLVSDVDVLQTSQIIYILGSTVPRNGSLILGGRTLTQGGTFSQAQISEGRVTYSHNGSESLSDGFTFTVGDGSSSQAEIGSFSIQVTPVNDAPVITVNAGIFALQGRPNTLRREVLTTTDAEFSQTSAGQPSLTDRILYTLIQTPGQGQLFRGETLLSANSTFTQADIDNNRIAYNHNASNTNSDFFTFRVSDGVNNATDVDQTFNIEVKRVNTPPTLTLNQPLTLTEGGTGVISRSLLEVSDSDTVPPLLIYSIQNAPSTGTLLLAGVPLSAGGTFSQADINAEGGSRLSYEHNGSEMESRQFRDTFTFSVADELGGTIGTRTFTLRVNGSDDPATFIPPLQPLTVAEGGVGEIGVSFLSASDADTPANRLTYVLDNAPANGVLSLGGATLSNGASFTQADVNNRLLRYRHNGSETTSDGFTFRFSGSDPAESPISLNIDVTPVNDPARLVSNVAVSLTEGEAAVIGVSNLFITDQDTASNQLVYSLVNAPRSGQLELAGVAVSTGGSFTQADIEADLLRYVHSGSETTSDTFVFTATDGGPTPIPRTTFSLRVAALDDPATFVGQLTNLTLAEGGQADIGVSYLSATDADTPANSILYTLEAAPTNGFLSLGSTTLSVGSTVRQSDITSRLLRYRHNGSETTNDAFSFRLNGADPADAPISLNVEVTPVNDPARLVSNVVLSLEEGATAAIGNTNLFITDQDTPTAQLSYSLISAPRNGQLQIDGQTISSGGSFTQSDIDNGLLSYVHSGSETTTDTFAFSATDGGGTPLPRSTFSIRVAPINDEPTLVLPLPEVPLTLAEDTSLAFTGDRRISVTDLDSPETLVATLAVQNGTLNFASSSGVTRTGNGTSVTLTGNPTAVNSALGSLSYRGNRDFNGTDTLQISIRDQNGAGTEVTDSREITVTPVNDPPTLTVSPTSYTVAEDTDLTLTGITLSDPDAIIGGQPTETPLELVMTATRGSITVGSEVGSTLTLSGSLESLRNSLVNATYRGNENVAGQDTITITLNDQDPNGALSVSRRVSVNITPVNDPPSFVAGTDVNTTEDASGIQTVNAWASEIQKGGGADEASQTLTFLVEVDTAGRALFTQTGQPQINPTTGNLTYTLAPNASGEATVTVRLRDSGGGTTNTSEPQSFKITVDSVNDAPTFTKGANITIDEDATTLPAAATQWARAISAGPGETNQQLTFAVDLVDPAQATLFTTTPAIDAATGNLTFGLAPDANGTVLATATLSDDAGGVSAPQTFTIRVNPVNDRPVLSVPTTPQIVDEDTELSIPELSVTDIDANGGPLQLNLRVTNGLLSVGTLPSLTITGNNTSNMSLTGTLADLNNALGSLNYRGRSNFSGTDTLTIVANDQGRTGPRPETTTQSVNITVNGVNDAPTLSVRNTSLTVAEDTPVRVSGLSVIDADAGTNPILVTVQATSGSLTLGSSTGKEVSLSGTVAAVNTALSNMVYRGDQDYSGTDTLTITVNDQSPNGPLEVQNSISVTVTSINDAPSFVSFPTGTQTTPEDTALSLSTPISISDVDSPIVRVTLAVRNGGITLANADAVNLTGTNGSSSLTISGAVTDINSALSGLSYAPRENFSGADTLTVSLSDLDPATRQPAARSVSINVQSVNDAPVLLTTPSLLTLSEGAAVTISNRLLRATDVDNPTSQIVYTLVNAPDAAAGRLRLGTVTLSANGTFTQADIDSNRLVYSHSGSETVNDSFVFRLGEESTPVNVEITPVNDLPRLVTNGRLTVAEATSGSAATVIRSSLLLATDSDNSADDLRYTLGRAPNNGTLLYADAPLAAGGQFSQSDIEQGLLAYRHSGSETTLDSFTFTVSDGVAVTTTSSFNITVTPVNDPPVLSGSSQLVVDRGQTGTLTAAQIQLTDVDTPASNLAYRISVVPTAGRLVRSGQTLGLNSTFTQAEIDSGSISYISNPTDDDPVDAFQFVILESGQVVNGGRSRTFSIQINGPVTGEPIPPTEPTPPPTEPTPPPVDPVI